MKPFLKAGLLSIFMALASSQSAFASCGTFEVSKGDVKVQPADGPAVAAAVGSKICSGDTVIAADSARAKIKMEDGNELNISPNSKIVIETYQYDAASNKKKVMLNVLRGKVRATTAKENMYTDKSKDGQANTFQVRTKSAVAGVRGTDFLTSFDPKSAKMEVVTFRGKVEVGLPGPGGTIVNSVQVAVGQRTQVLAGAKTPDVPKALPAAELMKQNNESHAETPAAGGSGSSASATPAKGDGKGDSSKDRAPASTSAASTGAGSGAGPGGGAGMGAAAANSMVSTNDLPAVSGASAMGPPLMPAPPVVPTMPTSATAALTNNLLINNAIKKTTSNVSIILHVQK